MKKTLLITILFLGMMNLQAQETHFGARLAGSFTTFKATGDGASQWNDNSEGKFNFELGVVGEFMLADQFAIAPELNYAGSGDVASDSSNGIKQEVKLFTSYIQVPVMAKYYINDNFNLNFGPQIGFLMSADAEFYLTYNGETNSETKNLKDKFNATEFALNMGAGYKFENGLFFDFRYSIGMNKLLKNDDPGNLKSSALKFGIGYYFN